MARSEVKPLYDASIITDYDVYLFRSGTHYRLYEKLGAHIVRRAGEEGVFFSVWAPNAEAVSVIGEFNDWDPSASPLRRRADGSGIWEGFIPGLGHGTLYKYKVFGRGGYVADKSDPFAFHFEAPRTGAASVVWSLSYSWRDGEWMRSRWRAGSLRSPISIYEVHLGSWRRVPEEGGRHLTYTELAEQLPSYVKEMGFTHVEFLPVMEHPLYASWGYQVGGYFAPTCRYGKPQDFMRLIEALHREGISVVLDWVPSHFPRDEYGLAYFDGTHLYEYEDPRMRIHPDWDSHIFDYGKNEVRSFLISSALFWLDKYHADGLRVDAVASMLYLDYSRPPGGWVPNIYGGKENLEAISFLRALNEAVYKHYPDVQTIAEESTAWPNVSRPTYVGGLGFGLKWNMGWMHDALFYFSRDPIYRKYHHDILKFVAWYAYSENFVLPLSHDEVVHGKGSLLSKMPLDPWQKFANLRALYGFMYAFPGKKLLFMGGELGQWAEWSHDKSLDWHLLEHEPHRGLQRLVRDLNRIYRSEPALHTGDADPRGFEWIDANDWEQSVVSFLRRDLEEGGMVMVVCNFTPVPRTGYRVGAPLSGYWREILNTDASVYGGSGWGNLGGVEADEQPFHGRPASLSLTIPPLACIYLKPEKKEKGARAGEAAERARGGGVRSPSR